MLTVPIHVLPHGIGLDLPEHATSHSAGLDVRAAIPVDHEWVIAPGERKLVPTGLILGLPDGYEGQIRPRSGLALRHGVTVLNSPGTIDADYRGEVQVLLINHGQTAFELRRGERIAQLVVAPYQQVQLHAVEADALSETARGSGGYGSTGQH